MALPEQPDPASIDFATLTPLSPEIISRQATINIGTIGHVAHGKSTIVKAISGVQTVRFKNELERNITIKLGYANAKLYRCDNELCPRPTCFKSRGSGEGVNPKCEREGCPGTYRLLRHVSFVDCPGHDILMSTMLSGAAVMDGALLVIAANEPCPQPQTSEHLAAVEIMKLKNIVVVQNKVDLTSEDSARKHEESIKKFTRGTSAGNSQIIPTSAQLKCNIDAVVEALVQVSPPIRDFSATPRMIIIRSFDVNKPGAEVTDLKGGVAGGSVLSGVLKVGDEIEIRPGIVSRDSHSGKTKWRPIFSRIESLFAESNALRFAVPGGLIGVGTRIDPTLCRADRLIGQVLGLRETLPAVYDQLQVNYFLLRRLLGVKAEGKQTKVAKLVMNEILMVNIGSSTTGGKIVAVKADIAQIALTTPACTEIGEKVALSRRIEKHWRLIGWATILGGHAVEAESAS